MYYCNMTLLTSSQVARELGLSVERVRQLARSGVLRPDQETELGRLWAPETVARYAAERQGNRALGRRSTWATPSAELLP